MKNHITRLRDLSAPVRYSVTNGSSFLYINGEGFPLWRDEEYSDTWSSRARAQHAIDGCGFGFNPKIKVVEA